MQNIIYGTVTVAVVLVVSIVAKYIASKKQVVTVVKLLNNFKNILSMVLPDKYEVVFDVICDLSEYIADGAMTKEEAIGYADKEIANVLKKQFDIILSEEEQKIVHSVTVAVIELIYRDKRAAASAVKIMSTDPIKTACIISQ